MLGFVDLGTKEVRVYYIINNDRTKEKILPIVKKNVYSYYRRIINKNDTDENFPATRIYKNSLILYH